MLPVYCRPHITPSNHDITTLQQAKSNPPSSSTFMAKEHGSDPYDYDYDDVRCVEIPVGREDEVSIFVTGGQSHALAALRSLRCVYISFCATFRFFYFWSVSACPRPPSPPLRAAPHRIADESSKSFARTIGQKNGGFYRKWIMQMKMKMTYLSILMY